MLKPLCPDGLAPKDNYARCTHTRPEANGPGTSFWVHNGAHQQDERPTGLGSGCLGLDLGLSLGEGYWN